MIVFCLFASWAEQTFTQRAYSTMLILSGSPCIQRKPSLQYNFQLPMTEYLHPLSKLWLPSSKFYLPNYLFDGLPVFPQHFEQLKAWLITICVTVVNQIRLGSLDRPCHGILGDSIEISVQFDGCHGE